MEQSVLRKLSNLLLTDLGAVFTANGGQEVIANPLKSVATLDSPNIKTLRDLSTPSCILLKSTGTLTEAAKDFPKS